jgi:hypothetical protein
MAVPTQPRASRPLEGEDLKTTHWEDARHWMSIYADLLEFKRGILDRVHRDIATLQPAARKAAEMDVRIIDAQMRGYQARLDLWYRRIWDLQGLWLDPTGRMIRHKGHEVTLTKREFQLLQFLLNHPHRYFTTAQILGQSWTEPSLFPEEVRNYIRRLRKILVDLEIPVESTSPDGLLACPAHQLRPMPTARNAARHPCPRHASFPSRILRWTQRNADIRRHFSFARNRSGSLHWPTWWR